MSWFLGFVDDAGKFSLDNRRSFQDYIQRFRGEEIIVTVQRKPKKRSWKQLKYYRGVVVPDIARSQGETDPSNYQSWHEGIAMKFLRIADGPFGVMRRRSLSYHDMSQDEVNAYVNNVILWAETELLDCRIRRPDEVDESTIIDPRWT